MAVIRRPTHGPQCPLATVQVALTSSFRFSCSLIEKANQLLNMSPDQARKHVRRLILSLLPEDFAYQEPMQLSWNGRVMADVYGKKDRFGLWFIRFHVEDGTPRFLSCHESEHDMTLANGTVLRKTGRQCLN